MSFNCGAERARATSGRRETRPAETITRGGCPGLQRYAQTWTGDNSTSWHTMRWNQRMALTMSLSGMFNTGHDIGGEARWSAFWGRQRCCEARVGWQLHGW